MLILKRPLVFFDLETTGLNVESDRIVQLAAVKWHPDGRQESINEYLNPTIPIPADASAIHGITDADVADCPTFKDRASTYAAFFSDCDLAGFNSNRFDIPLLANEFQRFDLEMDLDCHCIDVCQIFHVMEPRDLAAAHRLYCGEELVDAHDAMVDVKATMAVLVGQLQHYAERPHPPGRPDLRLAADIESLSTLCRHPGPDPSRKLALDDQGCLVINFGQYRQRRVADIAREDRGYLDWMLRKRFAERTKQLIRQVLEEIDT